LLWGPLMTSSQQSFCRDSHKFVETNIVWGCSMIHPVSLILNLILCDFAINIVICFGNIL
jgi:hypothetical protein